MAPSPERKPKRAVDIAWDEDKQSVKKTRKVGEKNLATVVRHAIADNCKGFSEEQIHGRIVDGKTLYDRVYSAKQKQLQEPGSISTGK
eukprot:6472395-Amphidinium_carterae.1